MPSIDDTKGLLWLVCLSTHELIAMLAPGKVDLFFISLYQALTWFVCKWVVIIYYPLLANATHVQQIYGAAVIKSGTSSYVVVVEVSGLKWSRCWCETINLLYNYTIIFFLPHSRVLPHYVQLLCHSPIEGLNRKRELVQNFTLVLEVCPKQCQHT